MRADLLAAATDADRAIAWIRTQKSLVSDKPFFVYFSPGATHSPHHVPREWIERYKGRFAHGWDRQRELTFERQKELGVIPLEAELTKRHDEIPALNEMPDELKPVLANMCRLLTKAPVQSIAEEVEEAA